MSDISLICIPGWGYHSDCFEGFLLPFRKLVFEPCACADDYCEGLRESINRSSLRPPLVAIGWSLGGMIAVEAAGRYPELFKGLILIGSTAAFCSCPGHPFGPTVEVLRAMKRGLRSDREAALRKFFELAGNHALSEFSCRYSTEALITGLTYLEQTDLREKIPAVRVPVLLLHGTADKIVPWEAGKFLNEQFADSRLSLIDGGSHAVLVENPGALLPAVTRFLTEFCTCECK